MGRHKRNQRDPKGHIIDTLQRAKSLLQAHCKLLIMFLEKVEKENGNVAVFYILFQYWNSQRLLTAVK